MDRGKATAGGGVQAGADAPSTGYVAGGGPNPPAIAAWTEPEKAAQRAAARRLLNEIKAAIARAEKSFRIAPSDYRFDGDTAMDVVLENVADCAIDARGATFWFHPRHGIRLTGCRNVTVRGLTVDYDPVPFAQARVLAVDRAARVVEIEFDPAFPLLPERTLSKMATEEGDQVFILYMDAAGHRWRDTRQDWVRQMTPLQGSAPPGSGPRYRITRFSNNWLFSQPTRDDIVRPGDWIVFGMPGASVLAVKACEGLLVEDLTIYAAPGFGISDFNARGRNIYRRCALVRRPGTGRLLAGARDGFHSALAAAGPLLEECEIAFTMDDAIAIHGFYSIVQEQHSPGRLTVVTPFEVDFAAASHLRFYSLDQARPLGEAQVKMMRLNDDPAVNEAARRLPETIGEELKMRVRGFPGGQPVDVTLDRPLDVPRLSIVQCTDRCGAGAEVRACHVHDCIIRGIFVRGCRAVIENNHVERVARSGITMTTDSYWLEGPFAEDVQIVGNTVVDCGWNSLNPHHVLSDLGAIQISNWFGLRLFPAMYYPHIQNRGVRIAGNRIIRPGSLAVFMTNIREARIENNVIETPLAKPEGPDELDLAALLDPTAGPAPDPAALEQARHPQYAIFLLAAEDVFLRDNRIMGATSRLRGLVGIGPWTRGVQIEPAGPPARNHS